MDKTRTLVTAWQPYTKETSLPDGNILVVYVDPPKKRERLAGEPYWKELPYVDSPPRVVLASVYNHKLVTVDHAFIYERNGTVTHWMPLPEPP